MKRTKITKREQDVYNYIVRYRREMHFSPSMRDIMTGIGLHSVSTVHRHVHSLIEKEWLLPCNGKTRSIVPNEEAV